MGKFERNISLFGSEFNQKLVEKAVLIAGLGGVGGYACEALTRLGVQRIVIVDYDTISESNINRQIIATTKTIGESKVAAFKRRMEEINPDINVETHNLKIDSETIKEIGFQSLDYIIDAVDDVDAKILLMKKSMENNIPMVSSMGMAKRMDSTQVRIDRLDKTKNDKLARKIRYLARKENIDIKKIMAVYSLEEAISSSTTSLPSIVTVPATAGLACATCFIKEFQNI